MKVKGVEITEAQQRAGQRAMVGRFTSGDVRGFLTRAGVEGGRAGDYVVDRAADRLLQNARKKGAIRFIGKNTWEAI